MSFKLLITIEDLKQIRSWAKNKQVNLPDKELFHLPTLMHNSLFINKCMLHYYPRHVSSINVPNFRRTNCIHTASGIVALCKRLHSKPVESRLLCSLLSTYILLMNKELCIKVGKWNNSILWCTVEKTSNYQKLF